MRPIVLLLAAAIALGACGGDDSELSVEEFRKQANELCAKANREVEGLQGPRSAEDLADFLDKGLELSRRYDRRIRELDPPEKLERLHKEGIRLADELDRDFERLIGRIRAAEDPVAELQQGLQRLLPQIQRGDELNRRLRLDKCLQTPGLRGTPSGPS